MSEDALDRPSLRLGKIGSVVWFLRRYFWRFFFWFVVLVTIIISGKRFIELIPTLVTQGLSPGYSTSPLSGTSSAPSTPSVLPSNSAVSGESHHHEHGEPILVPATPVLENDEVLGFVKDGVITKKGTLKKEDHIMIDGDKDYVKNVDVLRGILYLGSGKKVQK
jgi:hypothetical protein